MPEDLVVISNSTRHDKRCMAKFINGKTTHFGEPKQGPGRTYVDHHDKDRRTNYIRRHRSREDWDDPFSAGALARHILWGDSTDIKANIAQFKKTFRPLLLDARAPRSRRRGTNDGLGQGHSVKVLKASRL